MRDNLFIRVLAVREGTPIMSSVVQDLRIALRAHRRSPLFFAGIITVLALGIGANGAVFSLVQSVLLEPLPYERPAELVRLWSAGPDAAAGEIRRGGVADVAVTRWRDEGAAVLADVAGVKLWQGSLEAQFDLVVHGRAERLRGALVTPNFFALLGASAALGRTFTNDDEAAGYLNLVVLSHGLWQRAFGGDPDVIGRTVTFVAGRADRGPKPFVVIGVLPAAFRFTYPQETELWTMYPWARVAASNGRAVEFNGGVARLRPGVGLDAARPVLASVPPGLHRPDIAPEHRQVTTVELLNDWVMGDVRPSMRLLSSVAALLLVIACATAGNALLVRLAERQRELALRASLGASRLRLLRQLVLEGLVLSIAGTLGGSLVTVALLPVFRSLVPPLVPRAETMGVNAWFVVFAVVMAVAVTLVAALVPALQGSRVDLSTALKQSASGFSAGPSALRWRGVLVVAQTSVATALLVSAALLLGSFWRLSHVDLGYDASNVATAEIRLLDRKYLTSPPPEQVASPVAQFQDDVLARVRAIPGVTEVGLTTAVPFRGVDFLGMLSRDREGRRIPARWRSVDTSFFSVMGLRLQRGRLFGPEDTRHSPKVAIASASFARKMFGTEDALGQTFDDDGAVRIVGIVDDVRYASFAAEPESAVYMPRAQLPAELMCLVVRTSGDVPGLGDALRRAVHEVDPAVPVMNITTIGRILGDSIADRRFYTATTSAFAALALLLTSTGLLVVIARTIVERRRELAIRAALGAPTGRLVAMVARQGLVPVLAGAAAGLAAAWAGARLLQAFLFDIDPREPLVYGLALTVALVVGAAACLVPARRIAAIPPAMVLRGD